MAQQIKPGVYWVGVVDWELRRFHGHELSTHRGSTYNSYLILDQKKVLVDTAWGPFQDEFLQNVCSLVNPADLDMIVVNHAEPDHSGSLPALMKLAPQAQVVLSKRGLDSVRGYYHQDWNFRPVKSGESIRTGDMELVFIEAPMLHWPDTMFTYVKGRDLLLSNDAFGQHYATAYRFNDQVNREELYEEAVKYYANILTPFSDQVTRKIEELLSLNLPVDMIAPSHGVIWRDDPLQIVRTYAEWARQKPAIPRVTVVYDTMWHSTGKMAEAIGEGLAAAGIAHSIRNASVTDRNDLMTEIFQSTGIIVGSSTVNNGILPTLAPLLHDIKGHKFKNKVGAAFGSYGWSGESTVVLEDFLRSGGVEVVAEGVKAKWRPGPEKLADCRELGKVVAAAASGCRTA